MKFKRLRGMKGSTLVFKINLGTTERMQFRRVIRAVLSKKEGIPSGRLTTEWDGYAVTCTLSASTSGSLSGTYKYEVAVETNTGVTTLQYGYLEIL